MEIDGRDVDASSLDPEGQELPLLAFVLSAPRRRTRVRSGYEIPCHPPVGRRTLGSERALTEFCAPPLCEEARTEG